MAEDQSPVLAYERPLPIPRVGIFGLVWRFALGIVTAEATWRCATLDPVLVSSPSVLLSVALFALLHAARNAVLPTVLLSICLILRRAAGGRPLVARPWFIWLPTAAVYDSVTYLDALSWPLPVSDDAFVMALVAWIFIFPCLASLWLAQPAKDA